MVIYIDVLLFINTIINYAILMTTERLLKRNCRLYRILLGAFAGALFSLFIFVDSDSRLLLFLLRVLSSALLTLITFGWRSKAEYLKAVVCTIFVSVAFCGIFILFYQLFKPPDMIIVNDIVYLQNDPLLLIALTAVIYAIMLLMYKLFSERIKSTVVPLQFTIDTGCNLKEPFSCAPVIIADPSVFTVEPDQPLRIIPYTAIGGSSFLKGVQAESVIINKKKIDKAIYIASSKIENPNYQAIINSDIIR